MAALAVTTTATTSSRQVEEAPAGRMSSIEWEPKTLTLDQIKFAREAALYVVSTKTEEEAIRIFTEGLKPVQMTTATVRKSSSIDSSSDDDVELGCCCCCSSAGSNKGCCGGGSKGGRRGRRRRSMDDDRDVATAPF
ncbi:uncharacterized protein LOC8082772 [Sorghum bicolor]|uniref:Uncharacterized protein n=1 Tax=Sorghum bicolor TaxID=4558 RepID=C5YT81_SORBI|nr:uncharacterized protein LOC8082772 [Sorghum bicolor]EES16783.1 hypothetical protein SORBI_3008G062700 [Sorghum bicolor]|eukprot:XP_002442945.1 uncharacterized protein LOC8082772 [Sorghum bicolor]